MHSVQRSPEPAFLTALRTTYSRWEDLDGGHRRDIRDALIRDFGEVCAYCEQPCNPARNSGAANAETIDHFRPRSRFPHLHLDWSNLIYACYRCNQSKWNNWPGYDDNQINQRLSVVYPRYTPPSEYVSPNVSPGSRLAQEFFDFDVDTGEIFPADDIGNLEWSSARRTIVDIDLNDSGLGANDPNHLMYQRRDELDQLIQRLSDLRDPEQQVMAIRAVTSPGQPFSTFIRAYLTKRFPGIAELPDAT